MCNEVTTIRAMISEKTYAVKPQGAEVAAMRRAFHVFDGTPQELAHKVGQGHAFMCCESQGGVDSKAWRSQQLFALDFDNKVDAITAAEVRLRLHEHGLEPAFTYETYSFTTEHPRFRVVIALDEPYRDPLAAREAMAALLFLFPEADQACSDLARMFFGTGAHRVWTTDVVSRKAALDVLVSEVAVERERERERERAVAPAPIRVSREPRDSDVDLTVLKAEADLVGMAAAATDCAPSESGGTVYFHGRCPVCGHRDCFRVYPDSNTWRCYSGSNRGINGGSAIDYVMATEGLPNTSAGIAAAIDTLRR